MPAPSLACAACSVLSLAACASNQAATPRARVVEKTIVDAGATNSEPSLDEVIASACENNPGPPAKKLPFSPSLPPLPTLSLEDAKQLPSWLRKLEIGPWNGQQGVYHAGDERLAIVLGYNPAIAFSVAKDGALATRQLVWISDFDGDGLHEPATIEAGRVTVWFKSGRVEFNSDLSAIVGPFSPVARVVERGNRAVVLVTRKYDWEGYADGKDHPLGEWRKHAFSPEEAVAISFAPRGARIEDGLAVTIYREESPLWRQLFGRELCGDRLGFDARGHGPASWADRLEVLGVPAGRARVLAQHRKGCLDGQQVPPREFDAVALQVHDQFLRRAKQRFADLDRLAFRSCTSATGDRIEAIVSRCSDIASVSVYAWTITDDKAPIERSWFGSDNPRPTCGPDLPYKL